MADRDPAFGVLSSKFSGLSILKNSSGTLQPNIPTNWHVYILLCRDGTLYTGIAVDVARRLDAHQTGAGAKYTRSRLPVALVYQESQPDRSSALRRESALRKMGRAAKLELCKR